jgi:dihydrodipicolinate synthase/N-acetylneuraminate lyase
MASAQAIEGVVPVIPIPFHEDESIHEASLRRAVDFCISRKMAAICLPAYGSEFYKLSDAERESVIGVAIDESRKRIPVIAQANHVSARIAAGLAKRYESMGADLISFALPRQFGATERDLLDYCGRIASAVTIPLLLQDFNPGGLTIGAGFIANLHKQHPTVRYVKLEEPMSVDKLLQVREQLGEQVGLLGGWGGYYMLEAIPAGLCGIMPGVPICDLLNRVFRLRRSGQHEPAYQLFASVLPYIAFSLQDFETFLQIEKRLMVRRGLFPTSRCRELTRTVTEPVSRHMDFLIDQIVRILDQQHLLQPN